MANITKASIFLEKHIARMEQMDLWGFFHPTTESNSKLQQLAATERSVP